MTLLDKLKLYFSGDRIKDLGQVEEHVIKFQDYYIHFLIGQDDNNTSVAWDRQPPAYFNVRKIKKVK